MAYADYNVKDVSVAHVSYYFDYHAVETHLGFDRYEVIRKVKEFENIASDCSLNGFYTPAEILHYVLNAESRLRPRDMVRNNTWESEYLNILTLSLDPDECADISDIERFTSYLATLSLIFSVGLVSALSIGDHKYLKEYLYDPTLNEQDVDIDVDNEFTFDDEEISFYIFVPHYILEEDEDDEYHREKANTHSFYIEQLFRKIRPSGKRDRTTKRRSRF